MLSHTQVLSLFKRSLVCHKLVVKQRQVSRKSMVPNTGISIGQLANGFLFLKAGVGYKQSLSSHGSRERNSGLAFQSIGKNWQRVASGFIIGSRSVLLWVVAVGCPIGSWFKRSLGIGWSTRQKKRTKRKVALDLKVSLVYSFDLKVSGCIAQKQVSSLCLSLTSFALFFPSLTRPKGLVRSGIYSTVRSLSFTHSHSFE